VAIHQARARGSSAKGDAEDRHQDLNAPLREGKKAGGPAIV